MEKTIKGMMAKLNTTKDPKQREIEKKAITTNIAILNYWKKRYYGDKIRENVNEAGPCWKGYKQVGMKEKNGKQVPNCVPVEKAEDMETEEEPKIKKSLFDDISLEKTIRCKVIRSHPIFDSSFGNRIYRWINAYYLSEATNFEYKIVLQKELWPELIFLSLPHTFTRTSENFDFNFKTNNSYPQINEDQYIDVVLNKNNNFFNESNHWILSEWFICSDNLNGVKLNEISSVNPFNEIKFQFEEINEYFSNKFKDFVGIHIRRYKGIKTKNGDFEEIPENLREDYKKEYTECHDLTPEAYPFIPDTEYYRLIDNTLINNPEQCFYISTDLPLKFYSYYKEKYKNIFCFHDFKDEFSKLLKKY